MRQLEARAASENLIQAKSNFLTGGRSQALKDNDLIQRFCLLLGALLDDATEWVCHPGYADDELRRLMTSAEPSGVERN
jgi:hypothetical protein